MVTETAVFDRAVDINIGGSGIDFEGQDDEDFKFLPGVIKEQLSKGIQAQYGTVAPAFVEALLVELNGQSWEAELECLVLDILELFPSYVTRDGARRVIVRFALAALAGKIALRNNIFSSVYVNEDELMRAVYVSAWLWFTTRWNHLFVLKGILLSQKRIPFGGPSSRLDIFRHQTEFDGVPTFMISKKFLDEIFSANKDDVNKGDVISKRLKEDDHLVRFDAGRNTVGKIPYYHLRADWLGYFDVVWDDEEEKLIENPN